MRKFLVGMILVLSGCEGISSSPVNDERLSESLPGYYVHIYCDKDHHNLVYVRDNVGLAVVPNGC